MGFTKANHPLVIIPLVGLDVMGFVKTLTRDDIIRVAAKLLEHHLNIAEEHRKTHGSNASEFIVLVDMEGFSVKQYLTKQVLDVAIMITKLYEANYPCILKRVFIVNGELCLLIYIYLQ